jgi:predicted RNA-binding Zn-ribbon protein involved in translation (DUF1610 family)
MNKERRVLIFVCPNCGAQTNIAGLRMQFESQTGMKVIN